MYQTIRYEKNGNIGIATINRPEALNALNSTVISELEQLISEVEKDAELGAFIITGEGRSFVAGADIGEQSTMDVAAGRKWGQRGSALFRRIEKLEIPTIAAVNGFALGGGCELAMSCDIILAAGPNAEGKGGAKFGQPEVGLGITPGFSGTQRLPRRVGVAKAKELIFSGKQIGAEEAKRIGQDEHPLIKMGFQECVTDDYIRCLETGEPYPIKVAWMQTTNPLACTGVDAKRTLAAHMNIDTIVVVDLFMTPTAMALADYFLPACTYAERNGLRIGDGAQRAETINKAIEPLGESRSDMQITLDIGKRISPEAWPWETVEDLFSDILEETGHSFEEMQELAPGYPPFDYRMHEKGLLRTDGNPGFQTATGRIELWSTLYNSLGLDPLPSYEEPVPSPRSMPELTGEYPLASGACSTRSIARYRACAPFTPNRSSTSTRPRPRSTA